MQDGILLYCENATCNSLKIAWAIPGEHSAKPGATLELSEYELKYFAANASAISRATTVLTHSKFVEIRNLRIDTEYIFQLRSRWRSAEISNTASSDDVKKAAQAAAQGWSHTDPSSSLKRTAVEQNCDHGKRFELFFKELEPYVEPDWGTNAARQRVACWPVAECSPLYWRWWIVYESNNLIWRLRKIGIGAILFNEQLRDVAETLLSLLSVVGKGCKCPGYNGWSVLFALVAACQALEKPKHGRRDGAMQAGVMQTVADDQLLTNTFYNAGMESLFIHPAEIQWFTNQYPGGEDGTYLIIASSPNALRVKRMKAAKEL